MISETYSQFPKPYSFLCLSRLELKSHEVTEQLYARTTSKQSKVQSKFAILFYVIFGLTTAVPLQFEHNRKIFTGTQQMH